MEEPVKTKKDITGDSMRNLFPNMMNVILKCILSQHGEGGIKKKLHKIITKTIN